jgi:hypothetical protein
MDRVVATGAPAGTCKIAEHGEIGQEPERRKQPPAGPCVRVERSGTGGGYEAFEPEKHEE